ncbi:MAG: serine/threonine protein kinase [Balneolaceae bacterium]|nr:MAG: serine/threonine protein kinase [Balneolaceae bacterium]
MVSEFWNEIERCFYEALLLDEIEQKLFLKRLKKRNPELAKEVQMLISSHYSAEEFLDHSILETEHQIVPGEKVGPWKIVKEIGEGGMSTVFLAERDDGRYNSQVAIKFIYGFAPGQSMHSRLQAEQKILARLNHKNICRLLDAGIHKNGRPYFIMEYIDGLSIDKWCNRYQLNIRERLKLFIQVCEAVSYAHQRLIVHRDLKPSNILVDMDGNVKLLDFGIAKLVTNDNGDSDLSKTLTGFHMMTPEYASPEQILQKDITTATDVYGLGLLLCALLTGSIPYNLQEKTPLQVGKIITEQEPEKPSLLITRPMESGKSLISFIGHANTLQQVRKQLKGDLDNIILKALRKDPSRRYSSAEQFLQDIHHYLEKKPVSARPESRLYRINKFIQRHSVSVSAAALIFIILAASSTISLRQARIAESQRIIAEHRFEDVRQLANTLIFDVHDSISNLPGSTAAREMIVEKALAYLDELSNSKSNDVNLMLELAEAYRKVGHVQGNPTNANLGRREDAIESYGKGLILIDEIIHLAPENSNARILYAEISENMAELLAMMGNLDEADEKMNEINSIYYDLITDFPEDDAQQFLYARSLLKWGDITGNPNFTNLGNIEEAFRKYEEAEKILSNLYTKEPQNIKYIRFRGLIYERLGTLFENREHLNEALWAYEISMEMRNKFVRYDPLNTDAIRDEAIAYEKLGNIQKATGNLSQAMVNYTRSFEIFSWLASADPRNVQARQSVAISHIHLGDLFYHTESNHLNEPENALDHFKKSQLILNEILLSDSASVRTRQLFDIASRRLEQFSAGTM